MTTTTDDRLAEIAAEAEALRAHAADTARLADAAADDAAEAADRGRLPKAEIDLAQAKADGKTTRQARRQAILESPLGKALLDDLRAQVRHHELRREIREIQSRLGIPAPQGDYVPVARPALRDLDRLLVADINAEAYAEADQARQDRIDHLHRVRRRAAAKVHADRDTGR